MAKLTLDYYTGCDNYSDGDVEDRITKYIEYGYPLEDINNYVHPDDYFAFLYHLSPIRQNILNWYPFTPECNILEVGSGCGAITGLLCQKARKVTSVELSKRRAQINCMRNQAYDNLEIIVGNLNNLKSDGSYDYVILNGVLEYACSFTEGKQPFETFLENIATYLKPQGKLLVAIENRLGLKYFSGAVEDHTDQVFWGIKDYPQDNSVRTFSQKELQELLKRSGFRHQRFYYPYPDYKFPSEIYTEETINRGSYGRKCIYFEKWQARVFDEKRLTDTFKNEGIMGQFANSFLVEASFAKLKKEHVLYAKLNSSRKREYAIGTSITRSFWNKKTVQKYALCQEARAHLSNTLKNSNLNSSDEYCENVHGKMGDGVIEYPFIKYPALNIQAAQLVKEGKIKETLSLFQNVLRRALPKNQEQHKDIYTPEFVKVFGSCQLNKSWICVKHANIDLIADNIFCTPQKIYVADCEWVIDTWVPQKFILWRMLNEFYNQTPLLEEQIGFSDLLQEVDISDEEDTCFRQWANHFAENYVLDNKIDSYRKDNYEIDVSDVIKNAMKPQTTRILTNIYIDTGNGFSEEEKMWCDVEVPQTGEFVAFFDLSNWKNIQTIRWDPLEGQPIKCEDIQFFIDGQEVTYASNNAEPGDSGLFLTTDPQYLIALDAGSPNFGMKITGKILFSN